MEAGAKRSITELCEDDRPREKFEMHGGSVLSTAELLAILIGSGSATENAVQLCQRLMDDMGGSLSALSRMSIKELCQYKGLGPAKAISILSACELGKRRLAENNASAVTYNSSDKIFDYYRAKLRDVTVEECHVMLLSQSLRLINSKLISRGGITATVVDIRLVLKEALLTGATHIALCHNHPSGNPRPSLQDDDLTKRLATAAAHMDICLIDHIVFADDTYYSYRDYNKL